MNVLNTSTAYLFPFHTFPLFERMYVSSDAVGSIPIKRYPNSRESYVLGCLFFSKTGNSLFCLQMSFEQNKIVRVCIFRWILSREPDRVRLVLVPCAPRCTLTPPSPLLPIHTAKLPRHPLHHVAAQAFPPRHGNRFLMTCFLRPSPTAIPTHSSHCTPSPAPRPPLHAMPCHGTTLRNSAPVHALHTSTRTPTASSWRKLPSRVGVRQRQMRLTICAPTPHTHCTHRCTRASHMTTPHHNHALPTGAHYAHSSS